MVRIHQEPRVLDLWQKLMRQRVFTLVLVLLLGSMKAFKLSPSVFGRSNLPRRACTAIPEASSRAAGNGADNTAPRLKRVLSGVQPTGTLHLGNYLGAIRQWVKNQDDYDNFFCVVDMHAITAPHNPKELSAATLQAAAMYLACGIDPAKSKIFVQSHVKAHAELTWMLNCITPISWLERMIQYKEKAVRQGENVGMGLFDYPVLMASDILLYNTDLVPVGEDQRQHLELTRDISRRFNDQFCKRTKKVFREPVAMIVKEGARVMSLQDGTSKMSKSAENDFSRINLLDPPDLIAQKIKKCKTDVYKGIEWDNPERPEATNLLNMYMAVTGLSKEEVQTEVQKLNWGAFKPLLTDAVVAHLSPIQQRYGDIMQDRAFLNSVLTEGREAASGVANETLDRAKTAMGLLLPESLSK